MEKDHGQRAEVRDDLERLQRLLTSMEANAQDFSQLEAYRTQMQGMLDTARQAASLVWGLRLVRPVTSRARGSALRAISLAENSRPRREQLFAYVQSALKTRAGFRRFTLRLPSANSWALHGSDALAWLVRSTLRLAMIPMRDRLRKSS